MYPSVQGADRSLAVGVKMRKQRRIHRVSRTRTAVPARHEVDTVATRILGYLSGRSGTLQASSLEDAARKLQDSVRNLHQFGDKQRQYDTVLAALRLMFEDGRIDFDDRYCQVSVMDRARAKSRRPQLRTETWSPLPLVA